jgi:anti-sigma regulatory factor (Ser/Thr protein kinase)
VKAVSGPIADGHAHAVLLYHDENELLANALPLIRAGIENGDAVIVVLTPENLAPIRRELHESAEGVDFADAGEWYSTQANALTRYLQYAAHKMANGARLVRVLGEPLTGAASAVKVKRWQTYEALCNHLFAESRVVMICAYDVRLSTSREAAPEQLHPAIVNSGVMQPNERYVGSGASRMGRTPDGPPPQVPSLPFDLRRLEFVRERLRASTEQARLDPVRAYEFVCAVSEAASNAVEHGPGHGTVRVWETEDELVCEVRSEAPARVDPRAGFARPDPFAEHGRGFWCMRQLCDWVDVLPETDALVVRLYQRRG